MMIRARQRSGTLVGRVGEVAELDRGLERVGLGEPWFVQLVGEPGIGKTRLLTELGIRAEQRGWLVLDGRAAEFERDVPFGVIVDALNDYLGGLEPHVLRSLDDDALAELASVFPSLSPYADGAMPRDQGSLADQGSRTGAQRRGPMLMAQGERTQQPQNAYGRARRRAPRGPRPVRRD